MITVSIKTLVDAIGEVEAYRLPDMNVGTKYLYDYLYKLLSSGENVTLSGIDFKAFEPEDVTALSDLYTNVIESNACKTSGIMSAFRQIVPVCLGVSFV